MTIDATMVGRSYAAAESYQVGREKIREFADAVSASDPVHRDLAEARAKGYKDVIAPPTFAIILSQNAGQQLVEEDAGLGGAIRAAFVLPEERARAYRAAALERLRPLGPQAVQEKVERDVLPRLLG